MILTAEVVHICGPIPYFYDRADALPATCLLFAVLVDAFMPPGLCATASRTALLPQLSLSPDVLADVSE